MRLMNENTSAKPLPRLSREAHGRPAAPVRIVHLGLGNFTRAHQAWYTEHAPDRDAWGIAAFSGRTDPQQVGSVVRKLSEQDGVYTLIVRGSRNDSFEVVSSLSQVLPGSDHHALLRFLRDPRVTIVTTTVTEAGYRLTDNGRLDLGAPDVQADIQALRQDTEGLVHTVPARLVAGLEARRASGSGPITLLPCDNLAGNGRALHAAVADFAQEAVPALSEWMEDPAHVAWATTMVDRITPATVDDDLAIVRSMCGYEDAAPVATEPCCEWVIAGEFPAGRPRWEEAGAQIVEDARPYERRKLWMLNGAHSSLAYFAPLFGLTTVAEAIVDPRCRSLADAWWDLATTHLEIPTDEYRQALVERFENPRISHQLAQIAHDGSLKLPERILPIIRAERRAARMPVVGAQVIGAWVLHARGRGTTLVDPRADELRRIAGGALDDACRNLLALLDTELGQDQDLVARVQREARSLADATDGVA